MKLRDSGVPWLGEIAAQVQVDEFVATAKSRGLTPDPLRAQLMDGTRVEGDQVGWDLVREVYPLTGKARITGFTGPPGVGKSTLIGALTRGL